MDDDGRRTCREGAAGVGDNGGGLEALGRQEAEETADAGAGADLFVGAEAERHGVRDHRSVARLRLGYGGCVGGGPEVSHLVENVRCMAPYAA